MLGKDPDGISVVQNRSEADALELPPLLILDEVTNFLDQQGIGKGEIFWTPIGDGQSNVTFKIVRGEDAFILRRGPRPPLPPSTHDMVREARIQELVHRQGVPVPEILALCEDLSVLGVPFYVAEFLNGTVITDSIPAYLSSTEERKNTSIAIVDTLVKLHQVDVSTGDLAAFGKPNGYLKRQVERFSSLWDVNTLRDLPEVAMLSEWLSRNLPESQMASVIHGDFRAGNLMFAGDSPARVMAILDWEMATIGDPLADLGYLTATYAEPGSQVTPLELTSVTREPGYLSTAQLITRYQEQMDLNIDALSWYQTLALWKASIFCEAIYTRWLKGERPDDKSFAPSLEVGVPRLLAGARALAGV